MISIDINAQLNTMMKSTCTNCNRMLKVNGLEYNFGFTSAACIVTWMNNSLVIRQRRHRILLKYRYNEDVASTMAACESLKMKHWTVLAVVVALLCSSDDGRMDVALCDIAQPNYTDAAVQLRISAPAAAHERADGGDISLIIFYIIFFIYFLLSQAVANGYMLPLLLAEAEQTAPLIIKTARLTPSSEKFTIDSCFFFLLFCCCAHNTRPQQSKQYTHVWIHYSYNGLVFAVASSVVGWSSSSTFNSFRSFPVFDRGEPLLSCCDVDFNTLWSLFFVINSSSD